MAVKDINIRGRVQPTVNIRGEVQKTIGISGSGMIIHTTEEWNTTYSDMRSVKGYWYVYSDYRQEEDPITHEITYIPAAKIGDGNAYVTDLPFTTQAITQEDIDRWNHQLQIEVDDETHQLIFKYNDIGG